MWLKPGDNKSKQYLVLFFTTQLHNIVSWASPNSLKLGRPITPFSPIIGETTKPVHKNPTAVWQKVVVELKAIQNVTPWLIHVNVWQNPLKCCEVISLQLIKINEKKKKRSYSEKSD